MPRRHAPPKLSCADLQLFLLQVFYDPEERVLTVRGQREMEEAPSGLAGPARLERRFGCFQRRIKLPRSVQAGAFIIAKVRGA
jgi:HSP20 family molecular chaperone IbpA